MPVVVGPPELTARAQLQVDYGFLIYADDFLGCGNLMRQLMWVALALVAMFVMMRVDYHVIARNEGKIFQRDFKVITGVDGEVEVLAQ